MMTQKPTTMHQFRGSQAPATINPWLLAGVSYCGMDRVELPAYGVYRMT